MRLLLATLAASALLGGCGNLKHSKDSVLAPAASVALPASASVNKWGDATYTFALRAPNGIAGRDRLRGEASPSLDPHPEIVALGQVTASLIPGLNSALVLSNPKSTNWEKGFAVAGDMVSVVGIGVVIKAMGKAGAAAAQGARVGDKAWRVYRVGEEVCHAGCGDVAIAIQQAIGGDIKTIKPIQGELLGRVLDVAGNRFRNPAGKHALGWSEHKFVFKDGRVYDVLTGSAGMPALEYKALWEHADNINFDF